MTQTGPDSRRPGDTGRLKAAARGARDGAAEEAGTGWRRMRVGFQVLVLAVVAMVVFVLVFPTLRLYQAQQVEKAQLRAELAAAQDQNDELQAQLDRWEDPAYVKAQARERLSFVMPGDRSFRVSDPESAPDPTPSAVATGTTVLDDPAARAEQDPWYAVLWTSAVVAGGVPAQ
ncbi:MAG: septum formation initiator family protein [Bifidobacteriaceae bacterium]|nr:septum formation initiator family protein [Bifidobacteriaceae bacterium]